MVKKHIFILLFILLAIGAKGQNKFTPEWNVGVGFGPTFSSMDLRTFRNTSVGTKNLQQYFGGVAVRYLSEKNLGFIVELNYSQQGWEQDFRVKDNPQFEGMSHIHKLNYLELPILTHIYFGRKVRFVFNLGPKLSFLLNDSEEINEKLANHLANGEADGGMITHQYYRMAERKIDYSLVGGLGLEFRTGIGHFLLEGRYSFSLGDIYSNSKADVFARSANRVLSAKLTYYVKLF